MSDYALLRSVLRHALRALGALIVLLFMYVLGFAAVAPMIDEAVGLECHQVDRCFDGGGCWSEKLGRCVRADEGIQCR